MNTPTSPPSGQFRITTLLSWTAVIAVLVAFLGSERSTNPSFWVFNLLIFAPPLTCVPMLIDHLLMTNRGRENNGLALTTFWRFWTAISVGVYSMLMLMLATIAFTPQWKGSKGPHWFFYTLDHWAGITLWPIYLLGVILFVIAIFDPRKPRQSSIYLIAVATCAAVSWWYVFAGLVLSFTNHETFLLLVPASVAICYSIYAAIIWRNREYGWEVVHTQWDRLIGWSAGLFISILIKYPLAVKFYGTLPDEPPDDCFIVTAATRGHQRFVGTWIDPETNRLHNVQLLMFRRFERILKLNRPRFHRILRHVYNIIGPLIARCIFFRWQADLVYILLKPGEWIIRWGLRRLV